MTREEERKNEAKNRYPYIKGLPQTLAHQEIFIEGAKWADENPNQNGKELLYVAQKTASRTKKDFIERTKKWMKEQCYQEFSGGPLVRLISDELIEDYIKTMDDKL